MEEDRKHLHSQDTEVVIQGFYEEERNEEIGMDDWYCGRLKDEKKKDSIAIGASIKKIIPNPKKLIGKNVRIHGVTAHHTGPFFNLWKITKVEVLDEQGNVID